MTNYSLFEPPQEGKTYIYRSSAGSGKTFALTKAYLKLVLLDTTRYHQVLAITFTNDAKDEMKNRILEELTLLAEGDDSTMRKAILKDFKEEKVVNIEDVITSRAQTVLNSLLHDYSRFNVSTIDHFFSQLIRHLAKELNLNLGYELDIDNQRALSESVDLLFAQADKKLLGWLKEFSLSQLDDDKGWDVRKNIASLGKKLFQESYLDIEETLSNNADKLEAFIKLLRNTKKKFKESIIEFGKKGIEAAHKHHLQAGDFSRGMPYTQMSKMAKDEHSYADPPSATFMNALSLDTWHTKKCEKIDVIANARNSGMKEAHQGIVDMYEGADYEDFIEAQAILRYIHSYGVLASLSEKLQEYRSSHNLILISDTAFILNKVIKEAEIPFIYEKIGTKYRYILIDEFQDTSFYQWKSLLPFFHNAVSDGGQLFIVGDVKQSIYSWRGGDMKLLLHQVEKDINVSPQNIRKLDTNYRSSKNVISFNNSFFRLAPKHLAAAHKLDEYMPDFDKAYMDVEQQITKSIEGFVKVEFFASEDDIKWQDKAEKAVLTEIRNADNDGFALNDILILTRKTDEASRIARFLLDNGINALSEEALLVTSSYKVQLLISTLKYLKNNNDLLAIAEFNHFYEKVFRKEKVEITIVPEYLNLLNNLQARPVYEIVEEIIIKLEIHDAGDIYLQQLIDICFLQTKKGNATIALFMNWWLEELANNNSKELTISLPGGEKAIKVMTIHKAKGLEYPIVMMPYADSAMSPMTNGIFWGNPLPEEYKTWGSLPLGFVKNLANTKFKEVYFDEYFKNSLESLNLLYVAFTRAVERLYLFSNTKSKDTSSGGLIASVFNSSDFKFSSNFDNENQIFILGEPNAKESKKSKNVLKSRPLKASNSALSDKLAINQGNSRLFLSYNSEKSTKVKEGIALHKAMSLIEDIQSIPLVLKRLESEQIISPSMAVSLNEKISLLFDKIPQLKDWFSGGYEVLNERKILTQGEVFIPDRVMIKEEKAIIIDYKREKKDPKHHKQIKNYGDLLQKMGYRPIAMYLIYIDDQTMVEVL